MPHVTDTQVEEAFTAPLTYGLGETSSTGKVAELLGAITSDTDELASLDEQSEELNAHKNALIGMSTTTIQIAQTTAIAREYEDGKPRSSRRSAVSIPLS